MRLHKWFTLTLLLVLIANPFAASDIQASQAPTPEIRLLAGTFNPGQGEALGLPAALEVTGEEPDQPGYYIVQFHSPVREAWKAELSALGVEVLDYIPDYAFKVRMDSVQAAQVGALEDVVWVGPFHPAYKLSPDLGLGGPDLLRVRLEQGADLEKAMSGIVSSGARVLGADGNMVFVGADANQLLAIANVLDVAWVGEYVLPEKHNEYGAGQIVGAASAHANGYDGSTQVVAVADSGLGTGVSGSAHPDIPSSRIVNIYNWPGQTNICFQTIIDDGPQDVETGHGTHTAASVVSDGGPAGEGKGAAPAASLVFQATENYALISAYCQIIGGWPPNGYFLTGLPTDLRTMYQQAYNAGARVHSNSWGAALDGEYTASSANTDDFIWNNPDMTITFSSGNAGTDSNNNGVVDNDSIGSPATAKNVITVGASEGHRQGNYQCDTNLTYVSHDAYQPGQTCNSMGGQNLLGSYGQRWPSDFSVNPLRDDLTAGNAEQMAAFSSRGPTDDGRIKPDLVAPGTWILSGFSGLYQEGYGDPVNPRNGDYQYDGWGMPVNGTYKYMGGTSMANPIAAGAATVVRDFYQKTFTHNASAALVKATLINSAVDLLDENNDGANDNDFPIPNVHEGWGRVNLANATDGSYRYMDHSAGLSTSGTDIRGVDLNAGSPFKVTLVWSDYPSTEAAALNLVNNLDLLVTSPGGDQYRGNVFSGGWSQTGGLADSVNNVENVFVGSAEAGVWSVQVTGANVPQGPQPFALVIDGDFAEPTAVTLASFEAYHTLGGIQVSWRTALELDMLGFNLYRSRSLDGEWRQINAAIIPSDGIGGDIGADYAFIDTTTQSGETYFYRLEALDIALGRELFGPVSAMSWYQVFTPIVVR